MNFYTDVPAHQWKIFGSYADGSHDAKSDYDVALCGVKREDLEHPFFEDMLLQLREYSIEAGKHLDIFIDQPEKHRLESIFPLEAPDNKTGDERYRAIDAGPECYRVIHDGAVEIADDARLMRVASYLSTIQREPYMSQEEFVHRQTKKKEKMERAVEMLAAHAHHPVLPGRSHDKEDGGAASITTDRQPNPRTNKR